MKIITLVIMTPIDQIPVSYGSGVTGFTPGMVTVSDDRISAGKITDMKLISTILVENRKTIHGMILFVPESVFLALLSFANPFVLDFGCLKFER